MRGNLSKAPQEQMRTSKHCGGTAPSGRERRNSRGSQGQAFGCNGVVRLASTVGRRLVLKYSKQKVLLRPPVQQWGESYTTSRIVRQKKQASCSVLS
jgi:hypothetical protein